MTGLNQRLTLTIIAVLLLAVHFTQAQEGERIYHVSAADNDLIIQLRQSGMATIAYPSVKEAIRSIPAGNVLLLLAKDYPERIGQLDQIDLDNIRKKKLKVYAEYTTINTDVIAVARSLDLERVVVTKKGYFRDLDLMSLLAVNGSYILPAKAPDPLLVVAKVAGFDKAVYGLSQTSTMPLLYQYNEDILAATVPLSNFATGRFAPETAWKHVWESILTDLTGKGCHFGPWLSYVSPLYTKDAPLDQQARLTSVKRGIDWFFNGHFLIDASWEKEWLEKYMGDGAMPVGPELPWNMKNGDGRRGILEGHCSYIYHDGKQKYRYWLRNDVQGESSMAFALSGKLLGNAEYGQIAENLSDFSFERFRQGPRNDPKSPSYGLLSWSVTNPGVYYGDDNARSILGTIVTAAVLGKDKWNTKVIENILANFRTTGRLGFRGERLEEEDLQRNGLQFYQHQEKINLHPHFEAWPWATYLWLYARTGYKPLLEKTKIAIRKTMAGYPKQWGWTNGIQQERARMLLPLAWLVRIEPTAEHKGWLELMVNEVLKNQVACGGIREELGDPTVGMFGKTRTNDDYGKHEAPLIFDNGDPVVDMLYTTNFAFVGLNEAAKAMEDKRYTEALVRMSDFLTRIQVKSEKFKSVDGAWFRAFNYNNWDYWASNADSGWGAWSTLTGWTQSWIISTQALVEMDTCIWDMTGDIDLKKQWPASKKRMYPE